MYSILSQIKKIKKSKKLALILHMSFFIYIYDAYKK